MKGGVDRTLFLKKIESDLLIPQIYVDDIVFGSTNEWHAKHFGAQMSHEFQMSLMGELSYSLSFQVRQLNYKFIPTQVQTTDIFTKPLDSLRFEYLWKSLRLISLD